MLVRAPNGTYEFIDFRETAPAAAFEDMYAEDEDLSIYGGLARYKTNVGLEDTEADDTQVVSQENYEGSSTCTATTASCPGLTSWHQRSSSLAMASASQKTSSHTWSRVLKVAPTLIIPS